VRRLLHKAVRIPITVKVPVVVVLLMLAIGAVLSERVLSRLVTSQERQLGDLANAYLDGLGSPLVEPILRNDPWEVFDVLDRARRSYSAVRPVDTIVTDRHGTVLASSDPRSTAIGAALPSHFAAPRAVDGGVVVQAEDARAFAERQLSVEGRPIGAIHAEFDISPLLAERRTVMWTLVASNAAVTLLLAALGWITVRRMVAPMKVLADHLESAADGAVEPIPESWIAPGNSETSRLFRSFNHVARATAEREALRGRLAEEERLGSLGRLASGLAHEINNPLGGLLNAVDTLKRHGSRPGVSERSIALLERGLLGIRDVVQAMLETHRADGSHAPLTEADLEDLRLLIGPEVRRRNQTLQWEVDPAALASTPVEAGPVRQAVLNLLLNAAAAAGRGGNVRLKVETLGAALAITVRNDGVSLPDGARRLLETGEGEPLGGGVGLRIVREKARTVGGEISVATATDGTAITLSIPTSPPAEAAA